MPVIGDEVGLILDRILLATDFSPASDAATKYAMAMAKRFSAKLMLTHVIDLSVSSRSDAVVGLPLDEMRNRAGMQLLRLVDQLQAEGIRSTSHTMEDSNPAAAIVRLAKRMDADLIVTGTSGRLGLSKMILGSCAEGVIRHAQCPVVTVGPQSRPIVGDGLAFHNIVFATDFNSNAVVEAAVACSFARDSMAKLYLCHIVDDGAQTVADRLEIQARAEEALANLVPDASYEWVDPQFVVEHGKTAEEILGLAKDVQADLIVLGARRSTFLGTHMVNGVVGTVLAKAQCPVMTVRARAAQTQEMTARA